MNNQQGFTLIEVVTVMGLLALIAALTAVTNVDAYRGYIFRNERNLAISALQRARSQAISNVCLGTCTDGKPHGVHFEAGKYVIFQGSSYGLDSAYDEVLAGSSNVSINIPSFDAVFTQLSGEAVTNPPGAFITLYDAVGHSSAIRINSEGQIAWDN